jgi:hypothetical protein
MAVAMLVAEVVIGALYVIVSLLLKGGEGALFLYGFGCGILSASLAVLLVMKTFPE